MFVHAVIGVGTPANNPQADEDRRNDRTQSVTDTALYFQACTLIYAGDTNQVSECERLLAWELDHMNDTTLSLRFGLSSDVQC
jgi:hypothetical protein